MKPVVSSGSAWACTLISAFGIVILSIIGALFYNNHETMMGSINDPEDGKAVAKTVFGAVGLYVLFFLFCGCQLWVMKRQQSIQL
ncbi:putative membrane protein [Ogataea parapolymorpha DL-1]|uniref:Membrane protein n=1 Tax=Ogataea parapolymorpha (strain ATCC 26012 / BCRC 20466 / JCM 22074 / NRRL Y-7560 / DL-1) TaxID=871575 RepID=W1QGV3_OGAPD|nr:putative membrane protein [Ogataea parapolymorpha DL-1]ESW99575.1 putative membrane protein [Ogataea parapolymorpha DL-1]